MAAALPSVRNLLEAWALLCAVCAVLGLVGWGIDGYRVASIFVFSGLLMGVGAYWYADRVALGMVGARELLPGEAPALHSSLDSLSARAGVLPPKREFVADRTAADLCGSPHGLADALIRLEQAVELVEFRASPATEPLYTINPFAEEGLAALFVTHPPVGERVRRLRDLDPDWR